jgi:hypothetical protein
MKEGPSFDLYKNYGPMRCVASEPSKVGGSPGIKLIASGGISTLMA